MNQIAVELETLTPIWTGDVRQECTTIKRQGIKGSLRFWYEAIVRFLGGHACDPTLENKPCSPSKQDMAFRVERWANAKGNSAEPIARQIRSKRSSAFLWRLRDDGRPVRCVCDACALFGCTGWASRFAVDFEGGNMNKDVIPPVEAPGQQADGGRNRGPVRNRGTGERWPNRYFFGKDDTAGANHALQLLLRPILPETAMTGVLVTLRLLEQRGALGAKTQSGYGVFRVTPSSTLGIDQEALKTFKDSLATEGMRPEDATRASDGLVKLGECFFAELDLPGRSETPQEACKWLVHKLKYPIRQLFRVNPSCVRCKTLRHFLCGHVPHDRNDPDPKCASKIHVSRPWSREGNRRARVWGWLQKRKS